MAVKIRLRRMGTRNAAFYRVIIQDSRRAPTGRFIETIGWYDPKQEGTNFLLNLDRVDYWLGCAYEGIDDTETATTYFEMASEGLSDPSPAIFYNDQQPDKIFYQGLALQKLGKDKDAKKRFKNLLNYGKEHMNDNVKLDYFAISLPDLLIWEEDLNVINKIHCNYLIGLGELGIGNEVEAIQAFDKVKKTNLSHIPAHIHQALVGVKS